MPALNSCVRIHANGDLNELPSTLNVAAAKKQQLEPNIIFTLGETKHMQIKV